SQEPRRTKSDRLPHAAAGVCRLVDDRAVAADPLRAAELVDAATPLVDVLVAERLVSPRAAKRRIGGAASEGLAPACVDLTHLWLRRAREHAARVRHAPMRGACAIDGLETGEGGEADVDVAVEQIALTVLELTRAGQQRRHRRIVALRGVRGALGAQQKLREVAGVAHEPDGTMTLP